jgi:hypothetical protein
MLKPWRYFMAEDFCVQKGDSAVLFHYKNNNEEAKITISSSISYGRKMYKGENINFRFLRHTVHLVFVNLEEDNNFYHLSAIISLLKTFLHGKLKHGKELKIKIPSKDDPTRELYCKHADSEKNNNFLEIGMYDKIYPDTPTPIKYMMRMHIGYAHCFLNALNKAMSFYQPNPDIIWKE